jgi:hypothetical protein
MIFIVKIKKAISSEMTRVKAKIFDIKHCLVDLYQSYSNYDSSLKIGHARKGVIIQLSLKGLIGFLLICIK